MHVRFGIGTTLCVLLGIASFGVATAHATPLNITESTDFASTGFASLGTLDIGVNSISGEIPGVGINTGNGDNFTFDTDTFSVILPVGDEITSASWIITSASPDPPAFTDTRSHGTVDDPLGGLSSGIFHNETLNLTVPYTTAGALDIEATGVQYCNGQPTVCTFPGFDYTLDYTVAAITQTQPSVTPEPSSLILLGTGVLGLAATARRRLLS
jgi:hypothetical protein